MTDSIKVRFDDAEVLARLRELRDRLSDSRMATVFREIGEDLVESTKHRFSTSAGPDGARWPALAESTVLDMVARLRGAVGKNGRLTRKGAVAVANRRPLVETGMLRDTIRYRLFAGGVEVGTNRFAGEWEGGAAVHQFGSRDGRIPARPFLGLSADDRTTVLQIADRYLRRLPR